MSTSSHLFSPYTLRSVTFRNRIVAAPMWQYAAENGFPTDWHLVHLGRFAAGGAGLVFQEGTSVTEHNNGTIGDLGIWSDDFIEPYRRITRFISENGAVPGLQLMHAGRKARLQFPWNGRGPLPYSPDILDWDNWEVVGATSVPHAEGYPTPRALGLDEIAGLVESWGQAARRAHEAGYGVLEIHAGHGYLLHEFLSATSNTRTDRYGGDFEGRARLLVEIVEAVRRHWPDDKPLFLRVSAEDGVGWSVDDTVRLTELVAPLGVDAIDCSSGGMGVLAGSPLEPAAGVKLTAGYQVPLAREVRERTGLPTMAVGLIVNAVQAESILEEGSADLIGVARELLLNPNWPVAAQAELEPGSGFSTAVPRHSYYLAGRERSMGDSAGVVKTRPLL